MNSAQDARLRSKSEWLKDLRAGFQVSLIALPLCLGIALASGFPPMAGIVSALIGGLLVSHLNGSYVTINGPAAGLIVVILSGVEVLGKGDHIAGYRLTLAAIVIAGVLEMLVGLAKLGRFSSFFPASAVHGMLAAIGAIIMVKQLPVMLGMPVGASSVLGILKTLPSALGGINPYVGMVGLLCISIIVLHTSGRLRYLRAVPAPLLVVCIGTLVGFMAHFELKHSYHFLAKDYSLDASYLLALPHNVFSSLLFPDFSHMLDRDFLLVTLSIAIIAALESLLSATAIAKLDPLRRRINPDRDIFAVGLGTALSGLCGGLPIIAEIVRSSANVDNKGQSSWANFFHSVFLGAAVLLCPNLIRHIPLAALAAVLVYTGYRLVAPREILKTLAVGIDQLLIFAVTFLTVLTVDILTGVLLGILTKTALHLGRGVSLRSLWSCRFMTQRLPQKVVIKVSGPLVFTNHFRLGSHIERLARSEHVEIDLTKASFIDHTALEALHSLKHEFVDAGGSLNICGHTNHSAYAEHPLAARRLRA